MAKRRRVQSTLNNQNISLPLLLLLCITVCCILIFQQQQLPQQTHQQHDQQKYDQIVDEKYLQPQQQYLMDLEQSAQSSSYLENIADLKKQEAVETSYEEATSRIKPVYAFINRDGGVKNHPR